MKALRLFGWLRWFYNAPSSAVLVKGNVRIVGDTVTIVPNYNAPIYDILRNGKPANVKFEMQEEKLYPLFPFKDINSN